MVKQKPVSVNWQTLFVFIPILDLWAFYSVQKLRMALLIFLVGFGAAAIALNFAILGSDAFLVEDPDVIYSNSAYIGSIIGLTIAQYALAIYLVRKWSKEWNKKF
ncbi:MAG: hypothetical protein V3R12_02000 [Nitrosopumilaceae archaeon]